ncbi:MAG TPA: hypothetical protein VFP36_14870, partial [Usitatibacter sp.]|nr:hypothetical protein [Usitatibacter sp.]
MTMADDVMRTSVRASIAACFGALVVLPSNGANDGSLLGYEQYGAGHQIAYMIGAAAAQADARTSGVKQVPVPGSEGKVVATVAMGRQDGQPVASIETKVPVNFLLVEAGSRASIVGDVCPAADGTAAFTVRLESGGAGSGGRTSYGTTLEARVTATVGEDAEIANAEFGVNQGMRSTAGGGNASVESRARAVAPGGKFAGNRVDFTDAQWVKRPSQTADETSANKNLLKAVMLG